MIRVQCIGLSAVSRRHQEDFFGRLLWKAAELVMGPRDGGVRKKVKPYLKAPHGHSLLPFNHPLPRVLSYRSRFFVQDSCIGSTIFNSRTSCQQKYMLGQSALSYLFIHELLLSIGHGEAKLIVVLI